MNEEAARVYRERAMANAEAIMAGDESLETAQELAFNARNAALRQMDANRERQLERNHIKKQRRRTADASRRKNRTRR